jgi:hypothetical protein
MVSVQQSTLTEEIFKPGCRTGASVLEFQGSLEITFSVGITTGTLLNFTERPLSHRPFGLRSAGVRQMEFCGRIIVELKIRPAQIPG